LGLLPFIILGAAAVLMEAPKNFKPDQPTVLMQLGDVLFFGGYMLILAATALVGLLHSGVGKTGTWMKRSI